MGRWRIFGFAAGGFACLLMLAIALAATLDRFYPPPLPDARTLSVEVVDRNGALLRVFAAEDGRWRMQPRLDRLDAEFLDLLIAYEDKRFWSHHGVDPLAMMRAAGQMVVHGRIVSGASTITMQLARLLEPRPSRTIGAKLLQMARAVQLEQRLSKEEILAWYLTLAPYGGNLEGVRAASLAYFGMEPGALRLDQAALLVALPQSPETRRPDRHPDAARRASLRVLQRAADKNLIDGNEVRRVANLRFSAERRPLPALAAHLAQRARAGNPLTKRHETQLLSSVQARLEKVAAEAAERLGQRLSVAIVMADGRDGSIVAQVGSAGFFGSERAGWIDMTQAQRSPGSTLKPFIYGLAFQEGVVLPETLISDRPADFAGYRPQNFDLQFQGDVSVRRALQLSLNVPAVRLLSAVGPARLASLLRRAGMHYALPQGDRPGLSIGLGGIGTRLVDLVQIYSLFVTGNGQAAILSNGIDRPAQGNGNGPVLSDVSLWHVRDILSGAAAPAGSPQLPIAYKTGTSYGYRDAWSIGFDGRYVIGVWIGRADNSAVPGLTGLNSAAPVLFEAFARSGVDIVPFAPPPVGAVRIARHDLPGPMRRYRSAQERLQNAPSGEAAPHIAYPPAGARIALSRGQTGCFRPLVVKLQGGRPPFRWLANGKPAGAPVRDRQWQWMPDGPGSTRLAVIDAAGRSVDVDVVIE
ncbi:penicillin-binding protein 1C [Hoeflea prorocentri]|uniref:peptidoglycan glycosyltransferase n=1 Tax=Hoeflea prorocentri TaxID=1922333 RepID=A0A9X3ULL9_9HYPH|nr:penicillin-binding protein 1C [Hoeflea prorocentri]MCY6383508.1 penicillin-binding protein 1C [Hoeflea prorocentri]MDA5401308.1 penicillin-binding protein 1C [Hoeflea prorocentri]